MAVVAVAQPDVYSWFAIQLGTITFFSTRGFADICRRLWLKWVILLFINQGAKKRRGHTWDIIDQEGLLN